MQTYPRNTKYKKFHKGIFNKANQNNILITNTNKGNIKLIASENGRILSTQLLAIRAAIKKKLKKIAYIKFSIFPRLSLTKKATGIRMGKGKGNINTWYTPIRYGNTICEIYTKSTLINRVIIALKKAQKRLPILTKRINFIYE